METPNTFNFLLAGYIFFSVTFLGYVVYLWMRWRSLQAEEQGLQEIEVE
jgi:hypothetical protein